MSELISKLKRGSGSGWETPWYQDSKPNWLVKVVHDDDKNETVIKIVHQTPTHVCVPKYIGDKKICIRKESCRNKITCDNSYPIFQCPVCKRKSDVNNFRWLFEDIINYHISKAIKDGCKIIIAPELSTYELTKILKGDVR